MSEKRNVNDLAEAAFRDHYHDVERFLRRRMDSADRAEELAQSVFVDAVVGLREFEPGDTPVLAWLYTVARRRLTDEVRRQARHPQPLHLSDRDAAPPTYGAEIADALTHAIGGLPEQARQIVVMRLLEGRPFAEIAGDLDLSEAACKMRFVRALKHLRERLTEEGVAP